ncbi:hypothetical protein ACFGVS_13660 [Mucilaginibacter sp. AW1-7]|uniref:hypothetical protein n=1 Tax=Mucilaginibacter sp. AW1-7 TaxID=3349874 RepID=UPI003F740586
METKYKIGDWVCQKESDNYPKLEVIAITPDGKYRCNGTNYRLPRKKVIDKLFIGEELVPWIDHSGPVILRDKSTFR